MAEWAHEAVRLFDEMDPVARTRLRARNSINLVLGKTAELTGVALSILIAISGAELAVT